MKQALLNVLTPFGFPVILHGSLGADEPFPANFFTFIITGSPDKFQFDNEATKTNWTVTVNFYSSDPHNVEQYAGESREALKAAGFIPQGKGFDLISDQPGFTGWTTEYLYLSDY